jgi:hypothetical protein
MLLVIIGFKFKMIAGLSTRRLEALTSLTLSPRISFSQAG